MNKTNFIFGFISVIAIVLAVISLSGNKPIENIAGGLVHISQENFAAGIKATTLDLTGEAQLAGLVSGGAVYTASLATSSIAAATVCDYGTWIITPTDAVSAVLKLTLPSTTTLAADCLDSVGDSKSIFLVNGATQATSTSFIAGLGIDLIKSGDTGGVLAIATAERARITFYRISTATTSVEVQVLDAAD